MRAEVSPGSYQVSIGWPDAGNGNCGAGSSIIILKDHPRQLTLLGGPGVSLTGSTESVAGLLPFVGLQAELRYADPSIDVVPANVEGDAYYADNAPAGHAYLRIYGPRYRWVEFDLGIIGLARSRRGVVFNVSKEMLERALPSAPYRNERKVPPSVY